jgi:hypothetical protein
MLRLNHGILMTAIGLVTFAPMVSAIDLRPRVPDPAILSTELDSQNGLMVISGQNFGGQVPIVRLGDHIVDVKDFSPTKITVKIPPDIRPATYLLTVHTTDSPSTSGTFNTVDI